MMASDQVAVGPRGVDGVPEPAPVASGAPAAGEPVVISSLVVETAPELAGAVAGELAALPGVEVHERQGHKLVVTIEAPSVQASHERASSFIQVEGVTGVNLVYCNFEDEAAAR